MKRITNLIALIILVAFGANAQINTPQPSPAGLVSSTVGLTDVSIEYFRPGKKGRKIFGSGDEYLEQFGEIWRTGANGGTMVNFSTDVKVAGQDVKAGEYQMVSKPGASQWEVMLISEPIGGNESAYDESKVVAKATVTPSKTASAVERMTFQIADISADNTSANIVFSWDDVMWSLPIEVSFHEAVMKDIAAKTQVNPQNYVAAANYYLTAGENLEQALEWMNKYLSVGENSGQFWNVHVKAQILAKMGKKKEAIAAAQDSMEKAKNFPSGDFGYVKRNQDLIDSLK
ncbi:MAG: DUF2911 domain-containing protein [Ekhidna sp.]|uniref:DUF2911 domain-containing protein n=1 Tax=Ekhidna sp. TaxID=2608089 RepID=UPI0032EB0B70